VLKVSVPADAPAQRFLVVGRESVGKSELVGSLAGRPGAGSNWAGSTDALTVVSTPEAVLVDTPGIFRSSDTASTRSTLQALGEHSAVLAVVQGTRIDDDLSLLLPLVRGRRGAVAVTFWDKLTQTEGARQSLERLADAAGVPFVPVDARRLGGPERRRLARALAEPGVFRELPAGVRTGWQVEPAPGWLEHRWLGPPLASALLLLPAMATILGANRLAAILHPPVEALLAPGIRIIDAAAPSWVRLFLTARVDDFGYGLLNMGPFLLVWALPTVVLFALILGAYKASGLMDRVSVALHPWVRPLGLSGRALARVMMGFGCNVPAVTSTRSCSNCSREPAVAAIAFGSACSYQLPATLGVFAAYGASTGEADALALVYLAYLAITTAAYLRLTAPRLARSRLNVLELPSRPFMEWPTVPALWREASDVIRQFVLRALPVFVVLCLAASVLAAGGVLAALSALLAPAMAAFRLPGEAALAIVLASVRKDGILLLAPLASKRGPGMEPVQLLTAVYLAGVLLPCLATALAIGREISWGRAGGLLLRQAAFAVVCSLLLAWGGAWVWA